MAYLRVQASLGEILQVPEVRRDLYHLVEQDLVSEIKSIGEPTTLSARMSFEVTHLSRARRPPFPHVCLCLRLPSSVGRVVPVVVLCVPAKVAAFVNTGVPGSLLGHVLINSCTQRPGKELKGSEQLRCLVLAGVAKVEGAQAASAPVVHALIDSGASYDFVATSAVNKHGWPTQREAVGFPIRIY